MSIIQGTAHPAEGYNISRSLRFNSADSAYLNRTPSSAGNRKTWTLNFAVKRCSLTSEQNVFTSQPAANNWTEIYFRGNDVLVLRQYASSAIVFEIATTAVLRDVSGWYFITVQLDTTQATSTDRIKMYINGVRQSLTVNSGAYPTQNSDLFVNAANAHYIGTRSSGNYPNFYLTEVNFIDGQALTPSSFGETDPITGVWKPKKYTGTYGTNGFYLNFSDNSGTTSSTLGKDYSGNGNNWTPNNFSVTAGAGNDSLVDVPTLWGSDTGAGGEVRGNYATLNPIIKPDLSITYSNGNLQASGPYAMGTASIAMESGKFYCECTVSSTSSSLYIGVATSLSGSNASGNPIENGLGVGYAKSGVKRIDRTNTSYGATYTSGDVIGIAVDISGNSITFYKNGVSQGAISYTFTNPAYFASGGAGTPGSDTLIWNFGQRPFAYTAPSGFKALCTTNLP